MPSSCTVVILHPSEQNKRFKLPRGHYRVIARASTIETTLQIALNGDCQLSEQALAIAERFMAQREGTQASEHRLHRHTRLPDIECHDAGISRTHAMIFHDEHGVSIVDLMSTNGTRVNGELVDDADLFHGCIIAVGKTEMLIECQQG